MNSKINEKESPEALEAIKKIAEKLKGSALSEEALSQVHHEISYIKSFMELSHEQAVFFSVIFYLDSCSRYIDINEVREFLKCDPMEVVKRYEDFQKLQKKHFISVERRGGHMSGSRISSFSICEKTIQAITLNDRKLLSANTKFKDFLDLLDWFDISMKQYEKKEIMAEEFRNELSSILHENRKFPAVKAILSLRLDILETVLLLFMIQLYFSRGQDFYTDLECVISDITDTQRERLTMKTKFSKGMAKLSIENILTMERNDFSDWRYQTLSEKGISFILSGEENMGAMCNVFKPLLTKIMLPEKISHLKLFYNSEEERQVRQLRKYLEEKKLRQIKANLDEMNMPSGITALFFGSPGTGKTETAYQLGKMTGRPVMMVDISRIRSMWVGESEKNIKKVFDEYKNAYRHYKKYPVLLFNESDALISKRINVTHSVDQMQNNMQNILLQALEDFEGIFIATTNLTENLDKAFERRFLFKLRFNKPCLEARTMMWRDKLKDITTAEAKELAQQFKLSGGQIENVSRKILMDKVLNGRRISLNEICRLCEEENMLVEKKDAAGTVGYKIATNKKNNYEQD